MPRTQDEAAQSTASGNSSNAPSPGADSHVQPSPQSAETPPGALSSANDASAVCVEVPLDVHGSRRSNVQGQPAEPFNEETFSVIVFPHGGILRLEAAVIVGQMLAITNRNSQRGILCRVTNVRNYPKLKSYVEIVFSQGAPGFWGVRFPDEGGPTNIPSARAHAPAAHPAPEVEVAAPQQQPVELKPSARTAPAQPAQSLLPAGPAQTPVERRASTSPTDTIAPLEASHPPALAQSKTSAGRYASAKSDLDSANAVIPYVDPDSPAAIELNDDSATNLSELVEALQEATHLLQEQPARAPEKTASPSHADAHGEIPAAPPEIRAENLSSQPEPVAVSPLKSDDFWSTSFPEEILNWAIESAAIPAVEPEPKQKAKSASPVQNTVQNTVRNTTQKNAEKNIPARTAQPAQPPAKQKLPPPAHSPVTASPVVASPPSASPVVPSPVVAAPPAAAPAKPFQPAKELIRPPAESAARAASPATISAPPRAHKSDTTQLIGPIAAATIANASEPTPPTATPVHPGKPAKPDAQKDTGALGDLQSSMMKELERLALSHLDDDDDSVSGGIAWSTSATAAPTAPPPAVRLKSTTAVEANPPRPTRAARKALAAKGRTKFNPRGCAGTSEKARLDSLSSSDPDSDHDTIVIDSSTAELLGPARNSIPLGPLLGATLEQDSPSLNPLEMSTSSRANFLVVAVGVVMLVVVAGAWWFMHRPDSSASVPTHALPEPTGPASSQPGAQPAGLTSHPDPMDAAAAAALKAGAASSSADSDSTTGSAGSAPAQSHPVPGQPSSYQPAGSQPRTSQPGASPPATLSSLDSARPRDASSLPHDASASSQNYSGSNGRRLLMPAVKLAAPETVAHSRSAAAVPPPAIVSGSPAVGASGPGINAIVPNADASMPAPVAPVRSGPTTVGGRVREPRLIVKVTPVYPPEARQFNVQGDVTIDATIDPRGSVSAMRVISGPAALQRAAMDALKEWKYEPSTLNDRPISIHTIVTLRFTR